MSWIYKHRKVLRVIILALLVVAIMGPWLFDVINVPAEYTCHAPNIRLNGDFCGTPLPGTWWLYWMVIGFVYASAGLVTGTMGFVEWADVFRVSLLLFLLVLPFFSTLLLILRGDRRRLQVFNVVAWVLALGLCLLMSISNYPGLFWVLWGIWLYMVVAVSALVLEVLVLMAGRAHQRDFKRVILGIIKLLMV